MIFAAPAIEEVLHAFAAWAPTMPEEVSTSVALLRLPPIEEVPPPMRGVVSLALRFGFTGSPEQGEALLAPMRRVATPVLDSVGPMSYAAVDGIHMDPPEPLPAVTRGGLLQGMPADLLDTLLQVAGPDVEVPLAAVEMRLMGGALQPSRGAPQCGGGTRGCVLIGGGRTGPATDDGRCARGDGPGDRRAGAVVHGDVFGQLRGPWRRGRGAQGVDPGRVGASASGEGDRGPSERVRWRARHLRGGVGRCPMSRPVVVVEPGQGHRVGNVEFLARTEDTPFFNLAIIVLGRGRGSRVTGTRQRTTPSWCSTARCP